MRKLPLVISMMLVGKVFGLSAVEEFEAQERLARLRQTISGNIAKDQEATKNENRGLSSVGERGEVRMGEEKILSESNGSTEHERMNNEAFIRTVDQLLPMNPQQVKKLKEVYEESQSAMASPIAVPAKPTSSSLSVDLSPRATPPIIRLGAGYISSLVFLDSTGQPWPIDSYSLGDPVSFTVRWDQKGNTLLIQSATFYKSSNLAIILRGLNTPVMLTLTSGQEAIDYRVDLRIPAAGPNASIIKGDNFMSIDSSTELLDFLNGTIPSEAVPVKIRGGICEAWLMNEQLYLRTALSVISPSWKAMIKSADGTYVYLMQKTPVVLATQNGNDKLATLILEETE